MKLSIITDEMTQDLDEAIRFAQTFHLNGLELRTIDGQPLEALSEKRLAEIRHICHEEGLEICNLASSFFKCSYSQVQREKEIEKLKRLLQAAHIVECQTLRGFAFFYEENVPQEQIASTFEKPLALLKDAGKQLLLESDPSVMTTNHRALRHLLDTINQPEWIGAIFDPGNDIYDPQGEIPYPDGFLQIQPYVKHIHIKDAVLTPEGPTCVCIGTGQVDYAGILDALLASGYNGYLSLENHYRKGRTIDEAQMKRPGGADFSDGGAEAAAESMAALQRMLKERRG